jgi:hypothetical protein
MKALAITAAAITLLAVGPALAKDAHCYTTDDGEYDCWFQSLDSSGSFEISAPGKPTFQLWIESPGRATVGATFTDGSSTPLPGTYVRSKSDGACWVGSETGAEICAW